MKIAVVYMSRHGTTGKVANLIAEKLEKEYPVDVLNLSRYPDFSPDAYDAVIIGGSIHLGAIQEEVQTFCEENLKLLLQKEIGLFICCLLQERQEEQLRQAFPEKLLQHSLLNACLGGEFLMEKMNQHDWLIARLAAKSDRSVSKINYAAVDRFTQHLLQDIA
ncbi:flavodoxin [Pontibacter qinzhouensis]|uniref:Flavodoxin n=1 Tax=Pontibacter qinzhouensis TaxID=2603253 RepID=A0A5C8JGJ6_9BACT|nr:flavodoxin domain-containing protein [Pontibacter qinzhouensis]TXK36859.1 flavodoxin [Pontibacter qinzhouensis]